MPSSSDPPPGSEPLLQVQEGKIINFLRKSLNFKRIYQEVLRQEIIDQAAEELSLVVTDHETQIEVDRQRRELQLERSIDLVEWLCDQMVTVEDWEAGIRDRLLFQKLVEELFADQIDRFFVEHHLEFDRVLLYQLIVPYAQLAQEIFYQIEEEEISFYEAAHTYDINERRRHYCGYEGWLYRQDLNPTLVERVFGANIREVTYPVHTEQGYHLLLVEEFIPAQLTPTLRQTILNHLFQAWLARELNDRMQRQS